MFSPKRVRAGIWIAVVVTLSWVLALVGFKAGTELIFGTFSVTEIVSWFVRRIFLIFGSGFILGLLFSAGVALTRRNGQTNRLTVRRATGIGSLGGVVVSLVVMSYYAASSFSNVTQTVFITIVPLTLFGSLIGYGIGRTAHRAELLSGEPQNESLAP